MKERRWRLVETTEEGLESDLNDSELVGISVMLTSNMGEPHGEYNVYYRARMKIQPQVRIALKGD